MSAIIRSSAILIALLATSAGAAQNAPPVGVENERKGWSWTMIDERVALGGGGLERDDVEHLRSQGFGAVVNFRAEFPHEEQDVRAAGMEYFFLNTTHAEEDSISPQEIDEMVEFIRANVENGTRVYIHCTAGWHRSVVGPVAFLMKERGWRFQEAYDHVASRRPGIEPRFADSLLAYEAFLFNETKLTLDIWTTRWDVAPNETLPVHALVTRNGEPVEGARVTFSTEGTRASATAITTADGRAAFNYTAPATGTQEYVHAWAHLDGAIDGYDRNTYWIKEPRVRAPTKLDPLPTLINATAGEEVTLELRVKEADGRAANARITITSPCATLHRDYTGWDGRTSARFLAPERNGTYALRVHAHRFTAEPVFATVLLVVGKEAETPPCAPEPVEEAPPDPAAEAPPEARAPPFAAPAAIAAKPFPWFLGVAAGAVAATLLLFVLPARWRR